MNQKLRAVLQTSAIGAFCVAVSFGVQHMVTNMTSEQFVTGLAVMGITACFYTIYSVLLARIEYHDHLKSMVDKK
jgi:hypothetical protein